MPSPPPPPPAPAPSPGPMFSTPFVLSFSLLLSLPVLFLLAPRFLPPFPPSSASSPSSAAAISPADELDDLALFDRAAASPANRFSHLSTSPNPRLKIAFLFLTNTDLHFAPLWDRFFAGAGDHDHALFNVYVHADPSANVSVPAASKFFDGTRFIAAKRTYRASATLISATRRLLAAAIIDDPANAFFAVLSQYCVPLHSFKYVYRSLVVSRSFDRAAASDAAAADARLGVRPRYKSFVEILSKSRNLWKRYTARGRFAMMPEVPFEQFRVGSQFFVLTRRHALMVVKDRTLWQKFRAPCYREDQCYPEEHYFPTLLSMSDPDGCTHYTLTRVNWTGTTNGHPYTYGPAEVSPKLIARLRESNHSESYLFARKFSPDCLKPLLSIANKVIFRD